ncbi:hypothetical protein PAAG_00742 [Paracoccidioides lutzii Pb01]|uniref:ZW10 C-terminal helical domain-containing protein n=1 Tax=Paracoccidioides lutzii (strain ATCC MYA-826 / Pb01) TaxID=502779 RepID=C1GQE7_PARBA|nr:hypothetical protein PAAG_00742 [Paracoccidioides lutzii Pb01]EEH37821.1 hypothetical protein PAAG_00742 [Paracoccidioides lutzii Pb01]
MAPKVSEADVCQAIYKSLTDGSFPEAENIVSAEFPSTAATKALQLISKAREEVENEISTLSRETASDVDGWISQAKQLHEEIERSRSTAREIVRQHEKVQQLQNQVTDAAKKVELLENEIAFSEAVTRNLEDIRTIDYRISSAHMAIEQGELESAIGLFEEIQMLLKTTGLPSTTPVLRILSENVSALRAALATVLRRKWDSLVKIDSELGQMTVTAGDPDSPSNLEKVLLALTKLDMLGSIVDSLFKDIYTSILDPILLPTGFEASTLSFDGDSIRVLSQTATNEPTKVFDMLLSLFKYLQQHLPSAITVPLNTKLASPMVSSLVSSKLLPSFPSGVDGIGEFQVILDHTHKFSQALDEIGCPGSHELNSFKQKIPRLWLNQRRIKSLDEVRVTLSTSHGETRKVERVETEHVSQKDNVFSKNADDWNAEWTSDNEESTDITAPKEPVNEEDDDFSAWGLDEPDTLEQDMQNNKPTGDGGDIDEDAWGWGDEAEDADDATRPPDPTSKSAEHMNGDGDGKQTPRREVTLRELYTITDIPDSIMSIIAAQVADSEKLASPEYSKLQIASSGPSLLGLPTLVIAMFKAVAPMFYSQKFAAGQMYLYNDSMYFAEQLRTLIETHNLSRLTSDIETVEKFGKIAYSKEMQSQRTILSDLLDGSQGFANCAEQPYLRECENAVSATVDRMRYIHKEWASILSPSALLQSIGSLLSTVINKMILDIEDLSDISDAESQRLAGFCNHVSKLEDLFLPEPHTEQDTAAGQMEVVPMTAVYVPNWLKFQYLINILESSLADIKYLWTEGELKLEFSPEEVTDLIKALFADSDHRRRAIVEIRRTSRIS